MELQHYCRNVQIELSGWQAKVKDVVRKLDQADTGDKANIVSPVDDLHIILEELDHRVSELETECLTEWHPEPVHRSQRLRQRQERYRFSPLLYLKYLAWSPA